MNFKYGTSTTYNLKILKIENTFMSRNDDNMFILNFPNIL